MNMFGCFLIFCLLLSTVDAQVTISADKSLPRDGETVKLICSIPSFQVPATWSANNTDTSLTYCHPSGPCQPPNDAARYIYTARASSISVTITSFNSVQDTFGWRCQYDTHSAVYVIKPVVPVTTVQLTKTSGETLISTINVLRGGITYIRCSTGPSGSRPPATFKWYRRTVNQSLVLIENQSISSTPGTIMVPGQQESDLVISYSTLTQNVSYHDMYIFCEARDETSTGNFTQSREVHINVVYPPVVQLFPNYSVYNVTEGTQNFVFNCNIIEANPLPQTYGYSWFHKSILIQGQTSSRYTIPSVVQKFDDGEYICTARNDYGSGTSNTLSLNVQYGAKIVNLTTTQESNTVNENSSASFHCHVDSNPLPIITWTREGNNTVLITESGVLQSQFRIVSAQCLDMGNYSCSAYNGIRTPVTEIVQLFVKCHPRTYFRFPQETKVYQQRYTAAILRFIVISYPLPSFTWTFIQNGSESKDLPASVTQYDDGHQSELRFTSLGIEDFGYYSVTANNSMGPFAKEVFEIIPADVPEVPSNVTVIDLTHNSVTIQWVAGYNGGPEQTFHIIASIGEFTRSVIVPDPGYGKKGTAVLESLLPGTRYSIYMTAINAVGSSNKTEAIIIVTPEEASTHENPEIPVGWIAAGIVAGFVVILCVVIGIFLWRRYQRAKLHEHVTDSDITRECDERSQIKANVVKQDEISGKANSVKQYAASGKVYEGLHFRETEASQYLELNDVTLEENRNGNIRPPENESYEKLHPYTNNDTQMYSSLKIPETSKDCDEKCENTLMKRNDI